MTRAMKEFTLATVVWLAVATAGCALLTPDKVADASEKRELICGFVEAWAPDHPELAKPLQLCQAGAELKEIAAAYAGCQEPE